MPLGSFFTQDGHVTLSLEIFQKEKNTKKEGW